MSISVHMGVDYLQESKFLTFLSLPFPTPAQLPLEAQTSVHDWDEDSLLTQHDSRMALFQNIKDEFFPGKLFAAPSKNILINKN